MAKVAQKVTGGEDQRLTAVRAEENNALAESNKMYDDMVSKSTGGFDKLIDASEDWVNTQTKLQNEQTDFAIKKINQEKNQAKQDYLKEQTGAYVDWQKQSNPYGVNAEQMASMGMSNTGYSESSQVSMYNAYQNRVATARASYDKALLNYNNSITEAKLQNSSLLAEIAYQGLQDQLKLTIESMQYKDTLLTQKTTAQREIRSQYLNKWKAVLDQINTEKSMAFQREQFEWQKEQAKKSAVIKTSSGGGGGSSSKGSKGSSGGSAPITDNKSAKGSTSVKNAALKSVANGSVTHYDEAQKLLSKCGISNLSPRMLNSAEWNKAKRTGELGSELEGVNSYKEYIKYYCTWAINNYA